MSHTAGGDPSPFSDDCGDLLHQLLHYLLPSLLAAALSTKSLVSRWRSLHSILSTLLSSLSSASAAAAPHHPLLLPILSSLQSTLTSLQPLSSRCLSPDPPADRLRLQNDLDAAAASLSHRLRDLHLLLKSGILHHHRGNDDNDNDACAIVLSLPGAGASRAELSVFVRDAFARLQIGGDDLKRAAIDSLLKLLSSDPAKISVVVVSDGDPAALVRLLVCHDNAIRDLATRAVSILAVASDAGSHALFDEGALGPLFRLIENGSTAAKEQAARAVEAITADPANAWAVSAYGGVGVLVDACRGGSTAEVRSLAVGALRNVAAVSEDARAAMAENGAVPVLIDLLASAMVTVAQRNAAFCLWALASGNGGGDDIKASMVSVGGLQQLVSALKCESDLELQEYALKAIRALSEFPTAARVLSCSVDFFKQLSEVIQQGKSTAAQLEAAVIAGELAMSEDSQRAMASCLAALVKMMELPKPAGAQESAANLLVKLLNLKSNRKHLMRDEKSVARIARMIDPGRDDVVEKAPPVSVALALAGSGAARRSLTEAGACQHLQRLAELQVPGAKKALQRIAGGRLKNLFSIGWRD